jgi:UDP-GlcNAc:undecaprenyl-phosphate GlcNAc-1-phosphate transferase
MTLYVLLLVSMMATVFCVIFIRPVAQKIGLVDMPDKRKHHAGNIPLVGGIAVIFGFSCSVLLADFSLRPYRGLFFGCALLLLVGVADDFKEKSPMIRLMVQLLVGVIMVFSDGAILTNFGNIFGFGDVHAYYWLGFLMTIVVVLAMINAINMLDGQDGLMGGVSVIQFALMACLAYITHAQNELVVLLILISALMGFLYFNVQLPWRKHANIFMGDGGSTVIGYFTVWFAIHLSQSVAYTSDVKPVTFLWILALPIFDLIAVFARRVVRGNSPFLADRRHIHHVIHRAGIDVKVSTLLMLGFVLVCGVFGIIGSMAHLSQALMFALFLAMLLLYLCSISFADHYITRKSSEIDQYGIQGN